MTTEVRIVAESKDWHAEMRQRLSYAQALQRDGYTFTEIAKAMRVPREAVVDALYYDQVRK